MLIWVVYIVNTNHYRFTNTVSTNKYTILYIVCFTFNLPLHVSVQSPVYYNSSLVSADRICNSFHNGRNEQDENKLMC